MEKLIARVKERFQFANKSERVEVVLTLWADCVWARRGVSLDLRWRLTLSAFELPVIVT